MPLAAVLDGLWCALGRRAESQQVGRFASGRTRAPNRLPRRPRRRGPASRNRTFQSRRPQHSRHYLPHRHVTMTMIPRRRRRQGRSIRRTRRCGPLCSSLVSPVRVCSYRVRCSRTRCTPIAGALLDFWHTDPAGVYDNEGYNFRGHQFADDAGRFVLETIVPGIYPGRTRHIHVRVQAPNQPILTTQLYFPAESGNQGDSIFNPALLVTLADAANGKQAQFTFVLDVP